VDREDGGENLGLGFLMGERDEEEEGETIRKFFLDRSRVDIELGFGGREKI